jgi:hypothetical protein
MVTKLRIELGAAVMSGDGKQLGSVKEIAADRFKVERRLLPAYWLANEYVDYADDGIVQVLLTREGIGAAKVGAPQS